MPSDRLSQLGKTLGRNKRDLTYYYNRVGYLPSVDRTRGPMTPNDDPCGQTGPHIAPFITHQNHRHVALTLAFYKPIPCPGCTLQDAVPDLLGGQIEVVGESRFAPPFETVDPGHPLAYVYFPAVSPVTPTETFLANSSFGPTSFFGVPNSGASWGLTPTVGLDNDVIQARWEFSTPGLRVCAVTIQTFGSITNPAPIYDGSPVTDPGARSDSVYGLSVLADGGVIVPPDQVFGNILPQSSSSLSYNPVNGIVASTWGVEYKATLGRGGFDGFHYFGGITLVSFAVWAAILGET